MPIKNSKRKKTVVINFRITLQLYKKLERYANTKTDESGQKLSAGMIARRLVLQELNKLISDENDTQIS